VEKKNDSLNYFNEISSKVESDFMGTEALNLLGHKNKIIGVVI